MERVEQLCAQQQAERVGLLTKADSATDPSDVLAVRLCLYRLSRNGCPRDSSPQNRARGFHDFTLCALLHADVRGAHRHPTQCTLRPLRTTRPQSCRRLRSTCTSLCLKLYTCITFQTNTWGQDKPLILSGVSHLCVQDCSEQMSRNFNENLSHEHSTISKEVIRAYEDLMRPSKGLNF